MFTCAHEIDLIAGRRTQTLSTFNGNGHRGVWVRRCRREFRSRTIPEDALTHELIIQQYRIHPRPGFPLATRHAAHNRIPTGIHCALIECGAVCIAATASHALVFNLNRQLVRTRYAAIIDMTQAIRQMKIEFELSCTLARRRHVKPAGPRAILSSIDDFEETIQKIVFSTEARPAFIFDPCAVVHTLKLHYCAIVNDLKILI